MTEVPRGVLVLDDVTSSFADTIARYVIILQNTPLSQMTKTEACMSVLYSELVLDGRVDVADIFFRKIVPLIGPAEDYNAWLREYSGTAEDLTRAFEKHARNGPRAVTIQTPCA